MTSVLQDITLRLSGDEKRPIKIRRDNEKDILQRLEPMLNDEVLNNHSHKVTMTFSMWRPHQ